MATQDINANIHIKDESGNINNIFPATKIGNVEGLQAALNAKANSSDVTSGLAVKVDKVTGKGLSTNDYTTVEKNKLAGIEAQANKTVVDDALSSSSTNPVQNKVINTAISSLQYYVTPQMFGAVGNGETDDTTAFVNAINRVKTVLNTKGILFSLAIPAGSYVISSSIVIPNFLKIVTLGTVYIISKVENASTFVIKPVQEPQDNLHHFAYYSGDCFDCANGGMIIVCAASNKNGTVALTIGSTSREYTNNNKNRVAWKSFSHISFVRFDTAIVMYSIDDFLNKFNHLKFTFNNCAVKLANGASVVNSGELFSFDQCIFGDCSDVAIKSEWTGNYIVEGAFIGCSFDYCYNGVFETEGIVYFRFIGCHFEGIGVIYGETINNNAYIIKSKMTRTDISSAFIFDSTDIMDYSGMLFKAAARNVVISFNNSFFRDIAQSKKKLVTILSDDDIVIKCNNVLRYSEYCPIIGNTINQIQNHSFQTATVGSITEHTQLDDVEIEYFGGNCEVIEDTLNGKTVKAIKYSHTAGNYCTIKSKKIPCKPNDKITPNMLIKSTIVSVPRIALIKFYDADDNQLLYTPPVPVRIEDANEVNVDTWTIIQRMAEWIAPALSSYFTVEWRVNPRSACDVEVTNLYVDVT